MSLFSTGSDRVPNMTVMRLGEDYKGMKARAFAGASIIENVKKRQLGGWVVGVIGEWRRRGTFW